MPFVTEEHRLKPDTNIPGDRCLLEYRPMIRAWKKEPRWTTADKIYQGVLEKRKYLRRTVDVAALDLAWQVFFSLHVLPYEVKKRRENGEVE